MGTYDAINAILELMYYHYVQVKIEGSGFVLWQVRMMGHMIRNCWEIKIQI